MAQSRLEKIGTIYSRITGIIKAGGIKLEDRPLWYDIYKAFPPMDPPSFDRPISKEPIKQIFYEEDIIRAKFHKKLGKNLLAVNLSDKKYKTITQLFIDETRKLKKENDSFSDDEIFEKAFNNVMDGNRREKNSIENIVSTVFRNESISAVDSNKTKLV